MSTFEALRTAEADALAAYGAARAALGPARIAEAVLMGASISDEAAATALLGEQYESPEGNPLYLAIAAVIAAESNYHAAQAAYLDALRA